VRFIAYSSWPLGALVQENSTKITTSHGLHSPNTWHELGFTIKRAQIRTYIAKMGGCCMSSTSEISKHRRTWPLATLRHIPIALGTSGALGVGWDTPRSIKVGHTPTGTMLRPPRRHFMRKYMVMWGKFRLPSTESLKNKTRVVRGRGGGVLAWGGGTSVVFFAHARPTLAVLWAFPRTLQEDAIVAKCGDEVSMGWGMGKTVAVVVGGGQNKSTNTHMNTGRQAHTHTGHLNGPGGHGS
jgi:hypothetical protein